MAIKVMTERDWNHLRRKHVDALQWADNPGTDFWLFPGPAVNGATTFLLSSAGWTTTSLGLTAGTGGDFLASGDKGTLRSVLNNAQNDLIQSPLIFGDYQHSKAAQLIMREKTLPRYLIMDALANFSVVANNEDTTGLGFVLGAITTNTNHEAVIVSNATNWVLRSAGDSDAGSTPVDTAVHWFRIILDRGSATSGAVTNGAEWFIDGTSQGTMDITADVYPVAFSAGSGGANNLIQLGVTHIYYEWNLANLDPLTV